MSGPKGHPEYDLNSNLSKLSLDHHDLGLIPNVDTLKLSYSMFLIDVAYIASSFTTMAEVTDEQLRYASWSDVQLNDAGKIVSVHGKDIGSMRVNQLRLLCQSFQLGGYKSAKKRRDNQHSARFRR